MSRDGRQALAPVFALDGLSGCGKSTLARAFAQRLGWAYLDSGAWYRSLTWAVLDRGGDVTSPAAILETLSRIDIHCHADGVVYVDGRPLREELRTPAIDRAVADVADHQEVRAALTERMQRLRHLKEVAGVVADGRDAGTVIFPDADCKVFVWASRSERARRRHDQLVAAGFTGTYEDTLAAIDERDERDSARGVSAPHPAPGSHVLDNTELTVEQAIGRLLAWAGGLVENQQPEPGGRD